ncbi:MAG: RNA polymerase factor sigma-54 [Mariniblastus sp.]|nr:RNA polymerase factor sigma-54 [Mariniblastus sp.]
MKISLGQSLQQSQTQKLAPRMIQSMEILQMPLAALEEKIEQELAENPVLEVNAPEANQSETVEKNDEVDVDQKELVIDEQNANADDFERLMSLDREVPDHFDGPRPSSNRIQEIGDRQHDMMANVVDRSETLQEHLLDQLADYDLDRKTYRMCQRIISSLNAEDGGYLRTTLVDLLPADASPEDLEIAEEALAIVQSLDPVGIAARDLSECLLLQLNPNIKHLKRVRTLIQDHLDDLQHNRLPQIQKATGYSIEQIREAWEELKKLDPKPASYFADKFVPSVTPDLRVKQDSQGKYVVEMDEGPARSLYISKYYRQRLANGQATPEEKEFIKRKITAAQWLIESIEQRRSTLTRVAQAIVDHQTKFLDEGPEHLEPLKMQQIADKVGVHVTTVSRAVDDKWIETPRGILPLKRFFVGGTTNDAGEDIAWDKIRLALQKLIDEEDKSKPYSDDEIVKRLKSIGLNVARRTVTKYRQKMNIPSSRQRRDWSQKK